MLALTADEIEHRARHVIEQVTPTDLQINLEGGDSAVGGGSAPTSNLRSALIALSHPRKSASQLEQQLRNSSPPVVARIAEDKVLLDLRTVPSEDLPALISALKTID
jgi:L-seryl-tRNA(Ser) seleniumtransferase